MLRDFEIKEGWLTVVCLLLVLLCVAWSIQAARWTAGLALLQAVVLLAGISGIVLAKSRLPGFQAHLLSLLAGFSWTSYLTGDVLARALETSTEQGLAQLAWRIQTFPQVVINKEASADNFVFVLLLGLLL